MNSEDQKRCGRINFFVASVLILAFIIDRFFKSLAINNYLSKPIDVVGKWFQLFFVKNPNIAFSLPFNSNLLLFLTSVIIIGLIYYLVYSLKKEDYKNAIYLGAITLGAISNLADRIEYRYVIDYFDLEYFTVFNIADIMIVGGVIGLFLSTYRVSHYK